MEKKYFYGVHIQNECAFIAYPSIKINTEKNSECVLFSKAKT